MIHANCYDPKIPTIGVEWKFVDLVNKIGALYRLLYFLISNHHEKQNILKGSLPCNPHTRLTLF